MATEARNHGEGTYLVQSYPWGIYRGGAALCSDGKVRKLARISQTADTFFSIPASVRVDGKTVSGYVTINDDVVQFRQYSYGKNAGLLPAWCMCDNCGATPAPVTTRLGRFCDQGCADAYDLK